MPKFIVTGSHGTLGSEFQRLIGGDGLFVDREELDITDSKAITEFINNNRPEIIINCAAYTNVDGAEENYEAAKTLNADAVRSLAEAANASGAIIVHFSTGMVFPGTDETGYNEAALPDPVNKYGASKLEGEKILQELAQKYYLIRTEWLYGRPQSADAKKSFIELMIEFGKSGKVKGVDDEIGRPTWSKDLALATIALIDSGQPSGIYHLANDGHASRLEWAKEIYDILGMTVEIEPVSGSAFPRPARRPHYELINNTKAPQLRPWQEALNEYLTSNP